MTLCKHRAQHPTLCVINLLSGGDTGDKPASLITSQTLSTLHFPSFKIETNFMKKVCLIWLKTGVYSGQEAGWGNSNFGFKGVARFWFDGLRWQPTLTRGSLFRKPNPTIWSAHLHIQLASTTTNTNIHSIWKHKYLFWLDKCKYLAISRDRQYSTQVLA